MVTMKQSTFQQPIKREGCLFLAYCFMANLRTDDQVQKAFKFACNKGWLTTTSCYCNTGMDTFINGLCSYFGTKRMSGVTRKHVNNNSHWIVVSTSTGKTVYDSIYGYSGSTSGGDTKPSTQKIRSCTSWTGYVEASVLNVRSSPVSGSVVTQVKTNTKITCGDEYLGSDGYIWYKVTANGKSGYVQSGYVVPKSRKSGTVTASTLNVRIGPGTSYSKLPIKSTLSNGNKVEILATVNGWYRISYGSSPRKVGYVSAQYIK
ncbi:enterotoxin [Histomonas meleagridis]|uniref:enterotoxin n=1 Tax=Histomonas meleagridis TaxID=135588 RepID=UPI003559633C|nr:enterotoxin [Histomonas meleagridis]KAH0798197.1 enterotoxin [Histomonas meleagridis]